MAKRCIICNEDAVYKIKNLSDYYCADCAKENFGDLDMLVKVEEEAQLLKQIVKEKIGQEETESENIQAVQDWEN